MLDYGFYLKDCMEGMKEYPDGFFDLAIVDPIYGDVSKGGYMSNSEGMKKAARINHYHNSIWNQKKTSSEYFKELLRVSKNQIIWGGNYFANFLPISPCWIVWDKNNTGRFADGEMAWTSFNSALRIFKYTWNGMIQEAGFKHEYRIHPTQKPVALYEWLLDKYANEGDIILDTHVGSGSSLVACIRKGFRYVGFEIDEKYYKDANERLKNERSGLNKEDMIKGQMNIYDFEEIRKGG